MGFQFQRMQPPKLDGHRLGILLRNKPTTGDVGIEIEVEGVSLPGPNDIPNEWTYHQDGSLRGEENAEYVLRKPLPFSEVDDAVDKLWEVFGKKKSKLDDSNRTSVHVHLNMQRFYLNRFTSFCALYFCFEEMLTQWCGEHRVGNLFCLRAQDAPAIITELRKFIRNGGEGQFNDNFHYAGLNANALNKFGSIEVRTLRGVSDPGIIKKWVKLLRRLHDISGDYADPSSIPMRFSQEGPIGFFYAILGSDGLDVARDLNWSEEDIRESMYQGIRRAQHLCYCRDWTVYEPREARTDPFGRIKGVDDVPVAAASPAGAQGLAFNAIAPSTEMSYDEFVNYNQTIGLAPAASLEPEYDDFEEGF